MKKYIVLIVISLIYLAGCSADVNTSNMTPQERFEYAMTLYLEEDYLEAVDEFESILLQYPGSEYADDAQFYLGKTRFARDEYLIAAYEFSRLINNMPASDFVSEAQYMIAESYYQLSPSYQLDQKYTVKSIDEYQAFIDFFPLDERVAEAEDKIREMNNKLARKKYQSAVIYEKMEYYEAALQYYSDVVEVYHDTDISPQALYNKIQLLIKTDKNTEALSSINRFLERYPEDNNYDNVLELKRDMEGITASANL